MFNVETTRAFPFSFACACAFPFACACACAFPLSSLLPLFIFSSSVYSSSSEIIMIGEVARDLPLALRFPLSSTLLFFPFLPFPGIGI
ncbi:hypothetical protein C8J55DRAFT_514798 [Lentinula edodes]|uniref:Uncharacterized protein n=1 Tax=Lentinula lateritia TaxID=40482 RepID=A0A9W9ADU5_9AGAR|nr:hypothetical protein C8J55DRAFT_514798 [Lentinula edodes]